MANAVARQVLVNGPTTYIVKLTIIGDGSGEETATRVNSVSGDMGTTPKLMNIEGNLTGFSGQLLWDATSDVFCAQLPADFMTSQDFTQTGGLPNNSGTGKTGDMLITTTGLGSGDSGSLVVWFTK